MRVPAKLRPHAPSRRRRPHRSALAAVATAALAAAVLAVPSSASAAGNPVGNDVSSHQGNVNWSSVKANGA